MDLYKLHTSNPHIFQQFSVKDILFLYYKCPQKEKILQLYSSYNQFVFSLKGGKIFHQGDRRYKVDKDSSYLFRRAGFLQEMSDDTQGWELLAFYLKDDYLKKIFNDFRRHLPLNELPVTPKEMMVRISINDRIRECYLSIIPYFNQSESLPEEIIEIKLKELLYNIFVNPENRNILSYINSLADGYQTPVWQVMESNYMYNLKLSEYAHLANRSLSAFKRDFMEYYGVTPGRWLASKRLKRAKTLIETSQKTIGEIAFENGYSNLSHFSRVFKDKYGITPTECRN